mmetsp:Transcript_874/g.2109  ORF Transcript_874/g.2109 Transcript_874/m.2109 type:complete len:113 (-) Transcript_874:111-449(-)
MVSGDVVGCDMSCVVCVEGRCDIPPRLTSHMPMRKSELCLFGPIKTTWQLLTVPTQHTIHLRRGFDQPASRRDQHVVDKKYAGAGLLVTQIMEFEQWKIEDKPRQREEHDQK